MQHSSVLWYDNHCSSILSTKDYSQLILKKKLFYLAKGRKTFTIPFNVMCAIMQMLHPVDCNFPKVMHYSGQQLSLNQSQEDRSDKLGGHATSPKHEMINPVNMFVTTSMDALAVLIKIVQYLYVSF